MPTGIYKRKPLSEETKKKIGDKKRGIPLSQQNKNALSIAHKTPSTLKVSLLNISKAIQKNKGRKYDDKHRANLSAAAFKRYQSSEERRKTSERQRGKRAPNWQGGKTPINKRLRNSYMFRLWRESVFCRDSWTCQRCFVRGGELPPHHIKYFFEYPELRFELSNGITLCSSCHQGEHKNKFMEVKYG